MTSTRIFFQYFNKVMDISTSSQYPQPGIAVFCFILACLTVNGDHKMVQVLLDVISKSLY